VPDPKPPNQPKTAIVLPGGGARGAFQVGVLKALAEHLPKGTINPFPIISGTSAGAVNAVVLAAKARRFRVAAAELEHVWGGFHCDHVYRTDGWTMFKSSVRWMTSIISGGLVKFPPSMLDNSPLRALLSRNVRFPRIQTALDSGWLDAVAIRYTARLGGVDGLCIMLMDVLSGLDELHICTAYEIDGQQTNVFPSHVDDLRRVKPIYETVSGWKEEIDGAQSYDDLPAAAHAYLDRIAELVGCPVDVVSVGPGRAQTIVLNESLTQTS